jgi:prepilin-type N-terminal cleavage/methylation domain-containing protein/prepilin-type processing-associated H-X9-DG protein
MKECKKAFTLIELLVVIAIIAIPVFASAREKARETQDVSNLKQLGLATLQYAQDYDEWTPVGITGGGDSGGEYTAPTSLWMWAIYPYVKSFAAYTDPDDSYGQICSYAYNNNTQGPMPTWTAPSVTAMLMDGTTAKTPQMSYPDHGLNQCFRIGIYAFNVIGNAGSSDDKKPGKGAGPRHGAHNQIAVLFADGHAKLSPPLHYDPSWVNPTLSTTMNAILPYADPSQALPAGAMGTMCTVAGTCASASLSGWDFQGPEYNGNGWWCW